MRKIILLALLTIGMLPTYSQTAVGIIAGYNSSTIYPKSNMEKHGYDISSTSGWRAGLIADQHLGGKFYLQPQLIFNQKGFNYSAAMSDPSYSYIEANRRLLYLELQATMVFKQQVGNGKLYVGAGHYIGRGISGREKVRGYYEQNGVLYDYTDYNIVKYRNKLPTLSPYSGELSTTYVRPYDFGINFLAGYEMKNGLFFNATYSSGLLEIGHYNETISHFYLGLSVGYFLKRSS